MTLDSIREVVNEANSFVASLKSQSPDKNSTEWSVITRVSDFLDALRDAHTTKEVIVASDILSRSAMDTLDWNSDLFHRITKLTERARKSAKGL